MNPLTTQLSDGSGNVVRRDEIQAAPSQTLITEQEVMLASARAISAPLPHRRRIFGGYSGWFRRTLRRDTACRDTACQDTAVEREPRVRRTHPRRTPDWYSDALMSREMRRL